MSDISNKKKLITNTLWMYSGKIISQLLGMLATILVIRKLPVDIYGTYVFIFGLFFIYQLFITSPLKNVLLRYVPELIEKKNFLFVKKMLSVSIAWSYVLIVIFSVILYYTQGYFSHFFNIQHFDLYINAFLVFVFCYALKVLAESIIASFLKHKISAQANIIVVIFRGASYLLLLNYINVSLLLYIEAVVSLIYVLMASSGIFKVFKEWKQDIPERYERVDNLKNRVRRFYLLSFFSELGYGIIGNTSDHYIIAAMSSPYYVGLYGFALKVFEMFYRILPFREFESILKPVIFTRYSSQTKDVELSKIYNYSVKVLMPLFILPFLYFMIFGKPMINFVFGAKYMGAYWVTVIMLLGLVVDGLFYPLIMLIHLKERLEVVLASRIVIVLSISLGIFFMDRFGIIGVAFATLMGEFTKNVFMFFLFRKHCIIKYDRQIFMSYLSLMVLGLMVFLPFQLFYNLLPIWVIGSVFFGFFYVLFLVNFHPLSKNDLKFLSDSLNSSKKLARINSLVQIQLSKLVIFNRR